MMSCSVPLDVIGIVVSYNPDLGTLEELLNAILPQVLSVVVVDNGSSVDLLNWYKDRNNGRVEFIQLGANLGVAAAQNVGINWARNQGSRYIVLFDQDSMPDPSMVMQLCMVAEAKVRAGYCVAGVGPNYLDERQNNPPPFIQVRGLCLKRLSCSCPDSVVEVDYLIASGCLIPMATLAAVGGMQEELFIDYVDIEWGLRAKNLGFQSFGACAASMRHSLGEPPIEFFGRMLPLHSPLRHYYHFRNAVWLYRQKRIPTHWKYADAWRLFLKYGFYSLFAKPRLKHLVMMTRGILDGVRGRMGPSTLDPVEGA